MKFYSTNNKHLKYSFKDAVVKGLAPDRGLFFPERIPVLSDSFFNGTNKQSLHEIGFEVALQFIGDEIPTHTLQNIVEEALNFPIPVVNIEKDIYTLELFHGPTCAFKDVGARFMARCLRYFTQEINERITILVATSGDTGSAVASGFYGVDGVDVVILYPSEKVSHIQEQQLTTMGKNITALEIDGTFDDCQHLVKTAFMDDELITNAHLTSANSINIARLIPQSFYYFYAVAQLPTNKPIVFSVPSGNFGNLTGGLIAQQMGLKIDRFIASTNINKIVPDYLGTGLFSPQPSIQTISNAMDVGNPSNFDRMLELYQNNFNTITQHIAGYYYTDEQTKITIKEVYNRTGYMLDPHGAIGYLGLKNYLKTHDVTGIFLETAHPAKFADVVEPEIEKTIEIPQQLKTYLEKEKQSVQLSANYEVLKDFLLTK